MIILCSACVKRFYIRLPVCCMRRYPLACCLVDLRRIIGVGDRFSTPVFWLNTSLIVVAPQTAG
jgi:hypothetical protein